VWRSATRSLVKRLTGADVARAAVISEDARMDKRKPNAEEVLDRMEVLAKALEQMLDAVREDIASLRDDVRRLGPSAKWDADSSRVARAPSTPPRTSARVLKTGAQEAPTARRKRDPRIDDD
jgi:hypothetical protein